MIRVAGVEIDVRQECIRAGGIEQRLRPKTFEVLLYLIEHRDRVVSKSELFESVWNGVAVTEDTLVQSIVEIRKALGDDPKSPQFVRTIPRVGYRLIAPIENGEKETPPPPPPKRRLWIPIAAGALLVATFAIALWGWRRDRTTPSAAPAPASVAIGHFESRTATPDLEWLREGLPSMMLTYLSSEPGLTLVDRSIMERLARGAPSESSAWIDVARRAGAKRLITGRFERSGDQIRVDAQLYDVTSGRLVGGSSIVSSRQSLLNDVDLLSSRLAVLLGSPPPALARRQSDRMTDSLAAYEAYSRGVAAADGLQNTEAVQHFERAIALDPEFAMAHARLGYTYGVTWTLVDRAKPYFAKALALGHRLTDRERLYVLGWQSIAAADYTRAIDHFRLLVSRYPNDLDAYARLGRLLIGEERLDEAIEVLRRGLVVDPEAPELNNTIGIAHSYLGHHSDAIAYHKRFVATLPDEPNAHDSLGLSYQWAGEYERAVAEYETALRLDPRFEPAIVHRAGTYWQTGRNREAIRELRRYIELAPSPHEQLRGYLELFIIQRNLGAIEPDVARRVLDDPDDMGYDVLYALHRGDVAAARRLADATRRPTRAGRGMRRTIRLWSYNRAEAARAFGDEARALEYAREAVRRAPPVYLVDDMEDALGDMLAALGRHDEAVAEYRRVLRLNANRGRTRYKLARSLEAKGDARAARAEYEHFLRVWKTADADAPEIAGAKRRLQQK